MTDAELPTLRVTGALTDALAADVLAQLGSRELTAFLLQRRWFGGKGRAPAQVRIGEVIEVRSGELRAAVARLDVAVGSGRTVYYQLPLAVSAEDSGTRPSAILARVEGGAERGFLHDAVEDARFREALGSAFARGAIFGTDGNGARWIVEPVESDHTSARQLAGVASRTVRAEQSNTSIIFGDVAIMKLFRRLEPGINPDVEIGRFLTTKTGFTHTPSLLGVVRYESGDLHSIAGMLQRFLPGSSDAWQDALERSRSWFAQPGAESAHPYASDAERLGRITHELHEALASSRDEADFAPREATPADVEQWAAGARRRIEDALALLGERLDDTLPAAQAARRVMDERDTYLARLDELVGVIGDDAGQLIRHHGDYHLGQVLREPDGDFQIIDFEGEPARPLAERRERSSALRDVAGMLRSFAYAAATLAAEQGEPALRDEAQRRAAAWERGAREAFLRGYLGGTGAPFLPATAERIDALRELFETEKVFYELSYELNNRPDWVWIPIAGVTALRATSTRDAHSRAMPVAGGRS